MTEYVPVPCDKCGASTGIGVNPKMPVIKRGAALCAEHSGRTRDGKPASVLEGWHWSWGEAA